MLGDMATDLKKKKKTPALQNQWRVYQDRPAAVQVEFTAAFCEIVQDSPRTTHARTHKSDQST